MITLAMCGGLLRIIDETVRNGAGMEKVEEKSPKAGRLSEVEALELMVRQASIVECASRIFGRKTAQQLWRDFGLPAVGPGTRATDQLLLPHVTAFVEARLVADSRVGIAARHLHSAYLDWAVTSGAPSMSLTRFGLLMPSTGIQKVSGRVVTYAARFR